MFGLFGHKEINRLEDEIYDLKRDLETRRAEVNDLRSLLKGEKAKVRDSECVFDFKLMKAFSVERQWDSYGPKTIIGYIKPENSEIGEWVLYCNELQHERLVAEFKKAMK
jgi:hypothetical protein